jgi:peptide chain release factor 2
VLPPSIINLAMNNLYETSEKNIKTEAVSESILDKINQIEQDMLLPDFWNDSEKAKLRIKELQDLKNRKDGQGPYDAGGAIVTIFSGAGGDDAEDFSAMLFGMYSHFIAKKNWKAAILTEHKNNLGGYRNISFEVMGKNVYGTLKYESGVHRLVRMSPFSSKGLRHTSFSMVEVVPLLEKSDSDIEMPEADLDITYACAGGPGGQNVNKRETAVRILHKSTKLSVHITSERSQAQNKEKAIAILRAKLYKRQEEERLAREQGLYISKSVEVEWGNQIRSYVLHPYKMVKDHRTDVEVTNPDAVLEGDIDIFIDAMKKKTA